MIKKVYVYNILRNWIYSQKIYFWDILNTVYGYVTYTKLQGRV